MKLILDNIRSTYNVGSIFRTADAFGVDEIICAGYTPTPEHETMQKTALGAQNSVQWSRSASTIAAVHDAQMSGYTVIALEVGGQPLRAFAHDVAEQRARGIVPRIAIVLGNETEGVATDVLRAADHTVGIPMLGSKESMNVSVTAGIVIYALS